MYVWYYRSVGDSRGPRSGFICVRSSRRDHGFAGEMLPGDPLRSRRSSRCGGVGGCRLASRCARQHHRTSAAGGCTPRVGAGRGDTAGTGWSPCPWARAIGNGRSFSTGRCPCSASRRRAVGYGGGAAGELASRGRDRGRPVRPQLHSDAAAGNASPGGGRAVCTRACGHSRRLRIEWGTLSLVRHPLPKRVRSLRRTSARTATLGVGARPRSGSGTGGLGGRGHTQ